MTTDVIHSYEAKFRWFLWKKKCFFFIFDFFKLKSLWLKISSRSSSLLAKRGYPPFHHDYLRQGTLEVTAAAG